MVLEILFLIVNKRSPAILCVIYKSFDCLKVLLEYGGVDLDLKDSK